LEEYYPHPPDSFVSASATTALLQQAFHQHVHVTAIHDPAMSAGRSGTTCMACCILDKDVVLIGFVVGSRTIVVDLPAEA